MNANSDGMTSVGWDFVEMGSSEVEVVVFDRFKLAKGDVARVAVLSGKLVRAYVHFVREKKKTVACTSKKGQPPEKCCKFLGERDQRFGLVLFQYQADASGELLDSTRLAGKLKLLTLSESRYLDLLTLHKKFGLMNPGLAGIQSDFTFECTDSEYQTYKIYPALQDGRAYCHYRVRPDWIQTLQGKLEKAEQKLIRLVSGVYMPPEEIMDLVGLQSSPSAHSNSPSSQAAPLLEDFDVASVLNEV